MRPEESGTRKGCDTLLPPLPSTVQQGTSVLLSMACVPAKAEMRGGFGPGALLRGVAGLGFSPLPTSPL